MALTEVRALLETLEFGVTPCTVIAPGLRESAQMLLEKGAPGEAPRLLALFAGQFACGHHLGEAGRSAGDESGDGRGARSAGSRDSRAIQVVHGCDGCW